MALPSDVSLALRYDDRFRLDPEDWSHLLLRSCAVAAGASIEAARRAKGIKGTTFQEGWRRAAEAIAAGMNAEGARNRAAFAANEDAEERLTRRGLIDPVSGLRRPRRRA